MKEEFQARHGGKFPGDLRSQCNGCAPGVVSEQGRPRRWAKLFIGNFWAAVFSGAALSVASVGIEDEDGTVFAGDDKIIPSVVDDLPQGRGTRAARAVNRGHKGCSWEHSSGQRHGRGASRAGTVPGQHQG